LTKSLRRPPNTKKDVRVFGDCDALSAICEATLHDVPEGIGVEIVKTKDQDKADDHLTITVTINANVLLGNFEGNVCFGTFGNREYLVSINGEVRSE
jgi:hypothetical protein